MIRKINHWSLNRILPSIDDSESLTVLELVGKNTNKINEIVDLVNNHIDTINDLINNFLEDSSLDINTFKLEIEQKFKDFTDIVDLKIDSHELIINESVKYIKDNLSEVLIETIKDMNESGELNEVLLKGIESINTRLTILENKTVSLAYNQETEELNLLGDELDESVSQMLEGEY